MSVPVGPLRPRGGVLDPIPFLAVILPRNLGGLLDPIPFLAIILTLWVGFITTGVDLFPKFRGVGDLTGVALFPKLSLGKRANLSLRVDLAGVAARAAGAAGVARDLARGLEPLTE